MKLKEIEKLCKEANKGPWSLQESSWTTHVISLQHPKDMQKPIIYYPSTEYPDAKFIAVSRELLPKLLDIAKVVAEMRGVGHLQEYNLGHLKNKAILLLEKLEDDKG